MNPHAAALQKNMLFRNKSEQEITAILARISPSVRTYSRNEQIVREGEPADRMGIVITGIVEVQKMYSTGKVVTFRFSTGSTFGEAVIFSKTNIYPATVHCRGAGQYSDVIPEKSCCLCLPWILKLWPCSCKTCRSGWSS